MDKSKGEQLGWGDAPSSPAPASSRSSTQGKSSQTAVLPGQETPASARVAKTSTRKPVTKPSSNDKGVEAQDAHTDLAALAASFDPVFLDTTSRRHLAQLVAGPVPTTMSLVSDNHDIALGVAAVLAGRWGSASQLDRDVVYSEVYLCEPTGERWTREDLDSLVLERVAKLPRHRHFLIMVAADDMDLRASERLLKTLEEPPSPTTFILLVGDATRLPTTIKGRLERQVELGQAPASERIEALVASGTDRTSAELAVSLAGRAVTLAPILASDPEVASLAATVIGEQEWVGQDKPVTHAVELAERCMQLAACWEKGRYVETPKTITPALRSRSRMIIRLGLSRHREASMTILRRTAVEAGGFLDGGNTMVSGNEHTGKPVSFETVRNRLAAADLCELQLRSYAPIAAALSALFIAG